MDYLSISDSNSSLINVRPVKDWRETTVVYLDVVLNTIIEMDTSQIMTSLLSFKMTWKNQFLQWNPSDFCGISKILVPVSLLWQPDIYVFEVTQQDESPAVPYLTVYSDGTVEQTKPLRVVSACSLNIFKFPFDSQICNLTFGTYTNSVDDIILIPESNSSSVTETSNAVFINKGDWVLTGINVSGHNVSFNSLNISQIQYRISIRRIPINHLINLIVPACFLVLVDIASMFIPMDGGERLGFKITVVLGFSVLLLILNDLLPASADPPILGVFCSVCLCIMIISIIDSIFICYMLHLSAVRPEAPKWMKVWILKHLAFVLRVDTKLKDEDIVHTPPESSKTSIVSVPLENELSIETKKYIQKNDKDSAEVKLLKKLLVEILFIRREMILTRREGDAKTEWNLIAFVLDRLILITYLVTLVIMLIVVLFVWIA
ncbi:5-hydroxytryptamine receptor 3A-like isoform X2 [Protopterus annectens]|nr:5-hydroxytryptamine receptor 3A-like isoform X2 [Protopterus annectens]